MLTFFYERCQRGIYGHRHRQKESKVMKTLIVVLLVFVSTVLPSRLVLQLENVALRHQLTVYQRTSKLVLIKRSYAMIPLSFLLQLSFTFVRNRCSSSPEYAWIGFLVGTARSRTAVDPSEIVVACVVPGSPSPAVGEAPGFRGVRARGFGIGRVAWTGGEGR